ncbi:MAG: TauD/TfdA family dioxygenase [Dolichospermum sp.]
MILLKRIQYDIAPRNTLSNFWTHEQICANQNWTIKIDSQLSGDIDKLQQWANNTQNPIADYHHGLLNLPAIFSLGNSILQELRYGTGVVRITGIDLALDDNILRLLYLALGLVTGEAITNYGRLWDVCNRGEDYRNSNIPISMTSETTSFHTDSSTLNVQPDFVGLLCLRKAKWGGESLITSAVAVHEELRNMSKNHLIHLYRDYVRDLVTPGSERSSSKISENLFPIFHFDNVSSKLTFRYMRYWIERAHQTLDIPLSMEEITALNALDSVLCDPHFAFSFTLNRGEMLWINNRTIAHNRSNYIDDSISPRLMVRIWIKCDL